MNLFNLQCIEKQCGVILRRWSEFIDQVETCSCSVLQYFSVFVCIKVKVGIIEKIIEFDSNSSCLKIQFTSINAN